jgi:DNA-binding Lrp family transcriptional regulator
MSKGVNSYEELARKFNVTRSTIYRRVNNLEKKKVITSKTRVTLDYKKLDIAVLQFGLNVSNTKMEKVIELLKEQEFVKMIWRTYGTYDLAMILFCNKGEEGKKIYEMKDILEKLNINSFGISVGTDWVKMDISPFSSDNPKGALTDVSSIKRESELEILTLEQ